MLKLVNHVLYCVVQEISDTCSMLMLCSAECADGYFGHLCNNTCRCYDETEVCDKVTGHCESGCVPGWTASDCQTGWLIGFLSWIFLSAFVSNCLLAGLRAVWNG